MITPKKLIENMNSKKRHINVETDTVSSICSLEQQDNLEQIEIIQSFMKGLID